MVSIRDSDVELLRICIHRLDSLYDDEADCVASDLRTVLIHIDELMQPAPPIEPFIVPMSEEQMKAAYPQR